jgi:hypothetical protein
MTVAGLSCIVTLLHCSRTAFCTFLGRAYTVIQMLLARKAV